MSPEVKAVGATVLCTLAIVSAGWLVWADFQPRAGGAEGEQTVVFGESDNGRLVFDVTGLALGSRVVTKDAESFRWTSLTPADGTMDTGAGRVQLGTGLVSDLALTEARLSFGSVAYLTEGVLHELPVPQDTLRLRVPGEPGGPGDRLLVVLDAKASLREVNGLLVFEPFVSEARWLREATVGQTDDPTQNPEEVRPSFHMSDSTDEGDDAGSGAPGGQTGDDVGKLTIFVRDLPKQHVQSLTATFGRVALDPSGDGPRTSFDGERAIDLRAYAGPEDRAELVSFQLPASGYEAVRFEFAGATADIQGMHHDLVIPQSILVVEESFEVQAGATTELLVDFSIEESLVLGTDGWEFRPVAFQFQRSVDDTDQDGVHDVADSDDDNDGKPDSEDLDRDGDGTLDLKPAQYRTGGSSLPTLGPSAPTPEPVQEPVDQLEEEGSRPIGSKGSLPDLPLDDVKDKGLTDVDLVGVPVWVVARRGMRRVSAHPKRTAVPEIA